MNIEYFKSISLLGRISYGIMCAEKFALAKNTNQDWTPLFERLWSVTDKNTYWDIWADQLVELLPECLFDSDTYSGEDFEYLTESEFFEMRALYKNMPQEWNTLLKSIHDIEDIYVYTSIPEDGVKSLEFLQKIISILESNAIALPDWNKVKFSSFSECDGRGNSFNFKEKQLSEIVK